MFYYQEPEVSQAGVVMRLYWQEQIIATCLYSVSPLLY